MDFVHEAFNGCFRAECLHAHWFMCLADALENGEMARSDWSEAADCVAKSRWRYQPVIGMMKPETLTSGYPKNGPRA